MFLVGFYHLVTLLCARVLVSIVLLDGCPGRDATLQRENTMTSDAVESIMQLRSQIWVHTEKVITA